MKNELIRLAEEARGASYSPYSRLSVGAALLTDGGRIYTGANIENAAYSPTVCAERVALFEAIKRGERKFRAIAISGGRHGEEPREAFYPCGVCRQVMAEFCTPDFKIFLSDGAELSLGELLPHAFGPSSVQDEDL